MNCCDSTALPDDRALEALILHRVLEDHPRCYRLADLARSLDRNPEVFAEIDVIRNGVDRLERAGLLYKMEDVVLPSAPAAYFYALPDYL
jgi:predicted MarR family transcription regulator